MVQITNLSMRFSSKILFENVNLKLDKGKKYGLIGANGAGKTTFLNILSGSIKDYEGTISVGNGLRIGILGQNQYAFEEFTIFDAVLYGNPRLYEAVKEKEELYAEGNFDNPKVNDRLGELEMICLEEDPTYEYEVNVKKILQDLNFSEDVHQNKMSSIQSSDKFKILLAQVLFYDPDILYLDEPTNNLDLHTISWLENRLKHHQGTLVLISHDRHFVNSIATHILDVDFKKIRLFTGNYDDWYMASTLITKQQELDRNKKLNEKKELEDFIRRFSANASKAKQATSRQKQLDKLDLQDIQQSSRRDPSIVFKMFREPGKDILTIDNISKSYDGVECLKNMNITINKGDKIALIGNSGVGKTTLCSIITGENKPTSGNFNWGVTVKYSYFPQDATDRISGSETLYDWLKSYKPKGDMDEIRRCLGRMLFNGEEQEKSIKNASGGEKHRMMLSKMMLDTPNFLILDEPDNHLDLEAIIALGEALHNFEGGVLCVSHDRELIDAFANRIIELNFDGSYTDFKGTYEDYMAR